MNPLPTPHDRVRERTRFGREVGFILDASVLDSLASTHVITASEHELLYEALARALGQVPTRLPITSVAHIVHADALTTDWCELIPVEATKVFIFGNPPFLGQWTMSKAQTSAMKTVWGKDYDGYLDFVTAWFWKAVQFFNHDFEGEFAFVSTNSIAQGQPVPALFGPIFREGWRIKFAYHAFPWDSQAPGQAAVHCVITGFTRSEDYKPRLFEYDWNAKQTREAADVKSINAYLLDAPIFW